MWQYISSLFQTNDNKYFGKDSYYNIKRCIVMKDTIGKGKGLFATQFIPINTIVWENRANGPAERYKTVNLNDLAKYSENEQQIIIKYGYQLNNHEVVTPLNQTEIDLDYSNYWNHSCDPNCLPYDEDNWISVKDINIGDELTIDYCTFDCNDYYCIEKCLCNSNNCRTIIGNKDHLDKVLIKRYRYNFLTYIKEKIEAFYGQNIKDID